MRPRDKALGLLWATRLCSAFLCAGFTAMGAGCGDELAELEDAAVQQDAAPLEDAAPSDGQTDRYAALEQAINEEFPTVCTGAAVAVVENGQLAWTRGFGTRDGTAPVQPSTLFLTGSVLKQMTATALLQQVEAGRVELDAPVTDYVPEFHLDGDAAWAPSITVRHLLTHSSGMLDFIKDPPPGNGDEVLSSFLTGDEFSSVVYLMAPPGRFWNYCNPGFMLTGLITERVTGDFYADYMRDHVFEPLGMTRTFFHSSDVIADGDYVVPHSGVSMAYYDNPVVRPAGLAWISVLDLARWAQFLMHGNPTVLADELRLEMTSAQIDVGFWLDLQAYGFGIYVQRGFTLDDGYYDLPILWHRGVYNSFGAYLLVIPSRGFALATLADRSGVMLDNSLLVALRTLVDLPEKMAVPDATITPALYPDYVGTYHDPHWAGWFTIWIDGTDLWASGPRFTTKLDCVARDNCIIDTGLFAFGQQSATFIRDSEGKVEYMRTRQFVGRRFSEDPGILDAGTPDADGFGMRDSPNSLQRTLGLLDEQPSLFLRSQPMAR